MVRVISTAGLGFQDFGEGSPDGCVFDQPPKQTKSRKGYKKRSKPLVIVCNVPPPKSVIVIVGKPAQQGGFKS
jgi:hypothetical protein